MDITDIMSSEFHWAKLVLGVTVGVVVNAVFVACYFRKKKKKKAEGETVEHEIEIIPPLEDDTLGVIDRYEKLHAENKQSYTNNASSNLDLLEQQLFENVQGTSLVRTDHQLAGRTGNNVHSNQENKYSEENNLAGAIREQVHRCHTAIVHLQNRLQNETSKRQQAEEWCSMLEKELTAHLAARQSAETKCEKLNQRIKLLTRKLKSQERILRKRQKEALQNSSRRNENKQSAAPQQVAANSTNGAQDYMELTSAAPSGGQVPAESVESNSRIENGRDNSDEDEDIRDEYTNTYTSFMEDDEPHFASDLDEEKIVEPQELQKIIEAVDEASDDEDGSESEDDSTEDIDLESEEEEPRSGVKIDDGGGFEIENDVMHQLVANAVCGDLSDLLSGDPDISDDDSLSDLVAANMSENGADDETQDLDYDTVDSPIQEGDISSESIGDTKSTREFWEKKASEEELPVETKEPIIYEHLENIKRSAQIRRGGSFRDPQRVSKIPILKPSGKEYSREAESVHTRSMNPEIRLEDCDAVEEGAKLSIEAMREHWEKNQRKWGSSHVINAEDDGSNGNDSDEHGIDRQSSLADIERSTDFKDLKEQWKKKNTERLGRPEAVTDINENTKIERDRSPGFQALKNEWESKTHEPDEGL